MQIKLNLKRWVVFLTEVAVVFFMALGVIPREASLFLTGLLVFYFVFSPLKDSIWLFIASIPLFVALPIAENFDSMANWRLLLSVLFLVVFFKHKKWRISDWIPAFAGMTRRLYQFEYLTGVFFLISLLSLFNAQYFFAGFKKILFLVNIILLYINVQYKKN